MVFAAPADRSGTVETEPAAGSYCSIGLDEQTIKPGIEPGKNKVDIGKARGAQGGGGGAGLVLG